MQQTQPQPFKLVLSFGLIFCVALICASIVGGPIVAPHIEETIWPQTAEEIGPFDQLGGANFDAGRNAPSGLAPAPVNTQSRDEIKRQAPATQIPTSPAPRLNPTPNPGTTPAVKSNPTTLKYSISFFSYYDDEESRKIESWFEKDPNLKALKASVNWQKYLPDNPLYQTRYASIVPVNSFPALIFTDHNGGHVHAVDRFTMPSDGATLSTDFGQAYRLQQSVVKNFREHPIGLFQDCTGGNCKPPVLPRRDRDRDSDGIFDSSTEDSVEGIIRMFLRPGESLFVVVFVVVVVVGVIYYVKRSQ